MRSSLLPVGRSNEALRHEEYLVMAHQEHLVGIDAKSVIELIEQPNVQLIPNSSEFLAGALNLRGEIISVLDLEAALYGESPTRRTQSRKGVGVILNINEERVCFLVPKVLGIFTIKRDQLTREFPFIPSLHSTCSIREIALIPLNDPETSEIVEIIDTEKLFSNRCAEWALIPQEKSSLSAAVFSELTEEELAQFDLVAHDSFFERQERLQNLKLSDFLLIQIGDFNFGISLPFIQQVLSASVTQTHEAEPPMIGWIPVEDTQIPVIDPRDFLFAETPPPRPVDYAIFTLILSQNTLAIAVDKIHSIVKASLADPKEFQDELRQFKGLDRSLIENIAYPALDDELSSFLVLKISRLGQLLLDNEAVAKSIANHSEHENELKGKAPRSTDKSAKPQEPNQEKSKK